MRLLLVFLLTVFAVPAVADKATGVWLTGPDGKGQVGHVRLAPCGQALCGKVLSAYDRNGKAVRTRNVGKRVIWGLQPVGGGEYSGLMYVSAVGKNVKGTFRVSGRSMTVRGCLGVICQSQVWTKLD
ncbi:DUF2147 domain-containing protein [Alisedimentitalea sp. MJ-SS2]|uniref:DUF2147 domain-containing protein n=1 Tax=Aliisedimentitalea sp. MJ-SS2 TaxID=3049795 RepID=UPI00290817CF|nr:DUF2147 domain-containing protein [Alisedimentitalea sp. MJ-SS2]MDU8926295.1 DUF2147 domain-containing protein [Alisedimentitalea sp. MJ-SS2]